MCLRRAKAPGKPVSKSTPSVGSASTCSLGLVGFHLHRPSLDLVPACSSPQTTVYAKPVSGLAGKGEQLCPEACPLLALHPELAMGHDIASVQLPYQHCSNTLLVLRLPPIHIQMCRHPNVLEDAPQPPIPFSLYQGNFSEFNLPVPMSSYLSVLAFQCVLQHLLQVLKTQEGHWMSPADLSCLAVQYLSSSHLQPELKNCSCTTACRCPATLQGPGSGSSLSFTGWVTAFAPTTQGARSRLSLFSQGCL